MLNPNTPLPCVELGRVVVTRTCLARLRIADEPDLVVELRDIAPLLRRHRVGDWGDVDAHDRKANNDALASGARLLSSYRVRGEKVWLITDAATDVCAACWAGVGVCEPDRGTWQGDVHFRDDLPPRRLSTTVLLPSDY